MNLPFIIATDKQKADVETRKLIRSHVMRGKNRVKPRRKPQRSLHRNESKAAESSIASRSIWPPEISRLLSSQLSAIRFAEAVEPDLIMDVLEFAPMFSKAMFVLDQCIIPEIPAVQAWFAPMLFDSAYLHAVCFTIQAYFDGFLGRTRSAEARRRDYEYYAKTVRILQERLAHDDDSVRFSDSTIITVLALSGHAYTTGDFDSAYHHCSGLLKLVSIRGVGSFLQNTKLVIEIIRCDLSMAMDKGSKPVLFAYDDIPWPLIPTFRLTAVPEEVFSKQSQGQVSNFPDGLHPKLAVIWTAMSDFCTQVNEAAEKEGAKLTEETFLVSMGSIMYHLLHVSFETGSIEEAFHLGLLAFAAPIFLHWNRIDLPDRRFTFAYRGALARLNLTQVSIAPRDHAWLLMVGALSMAHEPDGIAWLGPRLLKSIAVCNVPTWDGMRDLLNSLLWIGFLYDKPGQDIFDAVLSK